MREQRKNPRVACDGAAEIRLQWNAPPCAARVQDLSLTGCKLVILGRAEVKLRSVFELSFRVHGHRFRVRAKATGVRSDGSMGVEFVWISLQTTRCLHDVMEEIASERSFVRL